MKFCKDCNHFRPTAGIASPAACWHPSNIHTDPVYGYKSPRLRAIAMRMPTGQCGEDATLFEQRPPKPAGFLKKVFG
jgi:hypothetical protein